MALSLYIGQSGGETWNQRDHERAERSWEKARGRRVDSDSLKEIIKVGVSM